MIYYFKESLNLALEDTFHFSVDDEKGMKKEWVSRFWSIGNSTETDNGNLVFTFPYPLIYKTKKQAIDAYTRYEGNKKNRLVILHTIDRYRFHWLDFYIVEDKNGQFLLKKLKAKQAFFNKDQQPIDENGKIIQGNFKFKFMRK